MAVHWGRSEEGTAGCRTSVIGRTDDSRRASRVNPVSALCAGAALMVSGGGPIVDASGATETPIIRLDAGLCVSKASAVGRNLRKPRVEARIASSSATTARFRRRSRCDNKAPNELGKRLASSLIAMSVSTVNKKRLSRARHRFHPPLAAR